MKLELQVVEYLKTQGKVECEEYDSYVRIRVVNRNIEFYCNMDDSSVFMSIDRRLKNSYSVAVTDNFFYRSEEITFEKVRDWFEDNLKRIKKF